MRPRVLYSLRQWLCNARGWGEELEAVGGRGAEQPGGVKGRGRIRTG